MSEPAEQKPWSTVWPDLPRLPKPLLQVAPLILGLLLFVANNLAPLAAVLHPRPGYTPLLMPRNQDSAQYLTWIEACRNSWTIPDYHAPWQTEAALHVPLMWIAARLSSVARIPAVTAYLGLESIGYVIAIYGLAFLLRVFTDTSGQKFIAVVFMICAVPVRTFALIPALLLNHKTWLLVHGGYEEFLGGSSSDGFFQGVSCATSVTFGTAGALVSLALFGRYFSSGRRNDLWAASLVVALSGFFHPFEFIPITAAAALTLLWRKQSLRSACTDLLILGVPASAVVLFYVLPTLNHPWLKIATDLNRLHSIHLSHHEILELGLPVLLGTVLAFWKPTAASRRDRFLACYVVVSVLALHAVFLPWPQHFKDGLDYAAAILVVQKMDRMRGLSKLWATRNLLRMGFVVLLLAAGLAPHFYFRYLTYAIGATSTEPFGQSTALAPVDEGQAVAWLRGHAASDKLILAPLENAPWMATVPMHSFASHWIFSLTDSQQANLAENFFQGTLSDAAAKSLLKDYGVSYVLVPAGTAGLRFLGKAELRWTGQRLQLYEFPGNEMKPFPVLQKVSPGHYVWNPTPN